MNKTTEMRLRFCKGDAVVICLCIVLAILIGVVFWMKTGMEDLIRSFHSLFYRRQNAVMYRHMPHKEFLCFIR